MSEPTTARAGDEQALGRGAAVEEDASERDFWSTFGEAGVCVFWGVESTVFEALPPSLRRLLVGYTVSVAQAPDADRERHLDELRRLPRDERLDRLCTLATTAQRAPSRPQARR